MVASRFELPHDGVLAAQVCLRQRMPVGDPARLRSAARRSGGWAADLRRSASTLLSFAETPLWSGEAHRAFVEQIRTHAPSMSATADRYEQYASALNAYAGALDEAGPRLFATRGRLRQRCDELSQAHATVSLDVIASPASRASPYAADLLPLACDFKAGYDRWADALDRCIRALTQADEADPTRDLHGLSALGHRVAVAVGASLSPFERAVLHPSLHNISDCLGSLNLALTVLGLGLLFLCPPAGAACLTAATVLAVAQVAVDTTRRTHGEHVSNASLGMELAAAIPLGGSAVRGLRATDDVVQLVPGGGLMAHEGLDGGHTLAKHVGKSEEYLRTRLDTEPHIQAASTFYDRQSAETALATFMEANASTIARWLRGSESEVVLRGRAAQSLGIVIPRVIARPVEATGIRLVLRRSSDLTIGFRIHTAMVTR
jgi:uncharacterized protein YukE